MEKKLLQRMQAGHPLAPSTPHRLPMPSGVRPSLNQVLSVCPQDPQKKLLEPKEARQIIEVLRFRLGEMELGVKSSRMEEGLRANKEKLCGIYQMERRGHLVYPLLRRDRHLILATFSEETPLSTRGVSYTQAQAEAKSMMFELQSEDTWKAFLDQNKYCDTGLASLWIDSNDLPPDSPYAKAGFRTAQGKPMVEFSKANTVDEYRGWRGETAIEID